MCNYHSSHRQGLFPLLLRLSLDYASIEAHRPMQRGFGFAAAFDNCLPLRFQLRSLGPLYPRRGCQRPGIRLYITCVGEGACGPTSSLFLHGMPPGHYRPT